eukprot:TRINITY_DN33211_c0_g1_i1.p1 TRINITY_DN33211_c0_g1~~TRINITY_DN33211_c0_g1_i1.p1  ORF type:complete len:813 (-),score=188.85 TRINITY_DN33211_c0_g1_i1:41-2479(-)
MMNTADIKCEVTFKEGSEPIKIKEEPMGEESGEELTNVKSEPESPPDLSKANPLMLQANQAFLHKIKLEPLPSEEYLESELKIVQERKMRSQQFSANAIEGAEVFSCKMCKANYVSKLMLDTHVKQSHTTGPGWIHCQLCEYKFRKVNKFNEHMVACHGQFKKLNSGAPEEHNCTLCDFKSSTSFTLVTHMQKVHAEKPDVNGQFSCENCPFKASTINAIKSHRYLSHFQKNLEDADFDLSKLVSCVVCSSQLPNKELLKKHLQEKHNMSSERDFIVKHPVKKFICPHCDMSFQYWSKLETHESTKHPNKVSQIDNMYQCKKCDFKPMTMHSLDVHNVREHHSDTVSKSIEPTVKQLSSNKLNIATPPIKFSNMGSVEVSVDQPPLKKVKVNNLSLELSKSRIQNTGEVIDSSKSKDNSDNSPWLECTICPFKTLKEVFFTNHMHKVHNRFGDLQEVKRYSCRKCDSAFSSLLLFVGHKSKCKPLEGADCKKRSKAFRCAICNERFLEASIMQSHVSSHTVMGPEGVKFYKCPDCEHVYKNPRLLVDHIKNNHKADVIKNIRPLETSNEVLGQDDKDPLGTVNPAMFNSGETNSAPDQHSVHPIKNRKEDSFEDDPEIKELDDILNSFNNENEDYNKSKERNKANIESDEDGSDTSVDSEEEQEVNKEKPKKTCYSCLYCPEGPKTTFQSKDALLNHQKDIFGLKKNEKFFVRSHLKCPYCNYMIQCEVSMSKHLGDNHQIQDKKCENCDFTTNMDAIMNHHVSNNHKNTASLRTCGVCGIVLRDKKNLAGHYFSKHNILDPSKLKNLQTKC